MRYIFQLGADGSRFSNGRAVQLEVLDDDDYDALVLANLADENATPADRVKNRLSFYRLRLRACLKAYTEPVEARPIDEKNPAKGLVRSARSLQESDWIKVTQQELEMSGPKNMNSLFSRPDRELLAEIVRQMHEPSGEVVQQAMGELLPVLSE